MKLVVFHSNVRLYSRLPANSEDACYSLLVRVHLELCAGLIREAMELVVTLRSETALALLWTRLQVRELWQEVLRVVSLVELGLVWRRHGLVLDALPVDHFEPGVRLDLLSIGRSATKS